MPDPDDCDRRLEALEVKTAFMDDLLDHLNELVAKQQRQIEHLTGELRRLQQQQAGGAGPAPRHPRDDVPPHW